MSLESLIWFLLIGLIAGWLAGLVMKGGGSGILGNMVVGVIGALLGGWLFSALRLPVPGGPLVGSILVAFVGAIVFIAILRAVRRA